MVACFGLNAANARGNHRLALVLLFAFGLLLGVGVSSTVNYYSATDPTAVRQALGATALFVGGLGAGGYAIRRDSRSYTAHCSGCCSD